MNRRHFAIVATLSLVTAFLASGANAVTVKVGVIQPLTGAVSSSGNYVKMGAEIGRDTVNAGAEHKLELIFEDNKSAPPEAAKAAEKLVQTDKVSVLMGAWGSSMTLQVTPRLEQLKVPLVVETSSASIITRQGNPWVFRISPTSEMEALQFEPRLQKIGIKKADVLVVNNDWGNGAGKAFLGMVRLGGGTPGITETMEQPATEFTSQIQKLKESDSDTVFVTTAIDQLAHVVKAFKAAGLKKKVIVTGGSSNPTELIKRAGDAAEGLYFISFFVPWFPEAMPDVAHAKAFIAEWKKRGLPAEGLTEGFRGYDGVLTIHEAVKNAKSTNAEKIRDALWNVKVMGLNGPIAFEKDGPPTRPSGQNKPSIFVVRIHNNQVELVK